MSKIQLESAVSQMVANSSKAPVDSVSCLSGLDGKVGAVAYCNVTAAGATTRRTVEVSSVSGLAMNLTVTAVQGDNITYKYSPKP